MLFDLLYEDANFIVIDKKSNVLVHKNKYDSGETLIDNLRKSLNQDLYLVHRLDRETSGLMIVAKNKETAVEFQNLFKENKVSKEYLAIVNNVLPAKEVKIDLSIGKSKTSKLKFSTWNAKNYKKSCTYAYKLDKQLVLLKLKTGRTHQIRVHLFSIKCAVINDAIYSNKIEGDNFGHYLHAYRLTFPIPGSGRELSITCRPPYEFVSKMKSLNINYPLPEQTIIDDKKIL